MIRVVLRPPSPEGRLYPRYDRQADLLVVESPRRRPMTSGLNVEDAVIFDLDADGVPGDFEVLQPRDLWRVVDPFPEVPSPVIEADIAIVEPGSPRDEVHTSVDVITNPERSRVRVLLDQSHAALQAVALSEQSVALISGDQLVGFDLHIPTWSVQDRARLRATPLGQLGSDTVELALLQGGNRWGTLRCDGSSDASTLTVLPDPTGGNWHFNVGDLLAFLTQAQHDLSFWRSHPGHRMAPMM